MKSILITGASAGIGRATAEAFLAEGWRVGLVARRAEALEDVASGHKDVRAVEEGDVAGLQSLVERQVRLSQHFRPPGHSEIVKAGARLRVEVGDAVEAGQPLVELVHRDGHGLDAALSLLDEGIVVDDGPAEVTPLIRDRVRPRG